MHLGMQIRINRVKLGPNPLIKNYHYLRASPPRAKVKAVPTNGAEHGVASIVANTPVKKWPDIFGQIA